MLRGLPMSGHALPLRYLAPATAILKHYFRQVAALRMLAGSLLLAYPLQLGRHSARLRAASRVSGSLPCHVHLLIE